MWASGFFFTIPNKGIKNSPFIKGIKEYILVIGLIFTTIGLIGEDAFGLTHMIREEVIEVVKPLEIKIKDSNRIINIKD